MQLQSRILHGVVIGANLAAVLLIIVLHWPEPTRGFGGRYERNLMTWFTSVQLALAGFVALLLFVLHQPPAGPSPAGPLRSSWYWLVFAAGFSFLAFDEYAMIHERVDAWLADRLNVSWQEPPLLFSGGLIIGVVPSIVFVRQWWSEKGSLFWFAVALVASAASILCDMVEFSGTADVVRVVGEDVLELVGGAAFLLSFLHVLLVVWHERDLARPE